MSSKSSDTHELKPHQHIYGLGPWIKKNAISSADLSSSYGVCTAFVRTTVTWCLSVTAMFKDLCHIVSNVEQSSWNLKVYIDEKNKIKWRNGCFLLLSESWGEEGLDGKAKKTVIPSQMTVRWMLTPCTR